MDSDTAEASPSIKMGEDMIMNIKAALKTEKVITIINNKVYNYDRNPNSFSVHFKRTVDWCESVYDEIKTILIQNEKENDYLVPLIQNGMGMIKNMILTGKREQQKMLSHSSFVSTIREDITRSGYLPNKEERMMLNYCSSLLFRMGFRIKHGADIAFRFIRRLIPRFSN